MIGKSLGRPMPVSVATHYSQAKSRQQVEHEAFEQAQRFNDGSLRQSDVDRIADAVVRRMSDNA